MESERLDVSPPCSWDANTTSQVEMSTDVDQLDTSGLCVTCRHARRADATPLAVELASEVVATRGDSIDAR